MYLYIYNYIIKVDKITKFYNECFFSYWKAY